MKKQPVILVLLWLPFIALASCKTHGNKTATTTTVPAETTVPVVEPVKTQQPTSTKHSYRFIVSFYSIGGGIDNAAYTRLKQHLSTRTPVIAVDEIAWGREGETDMGFDLKELSTTEQSEFVTQVKALLKESELVRFSENTSSPNARN